MNNSNDSRLSKLPQIQREVAVKLLSANKAWDTSFAILPSEHETELGIRWEDTKKKAFAEFRWSLVAGQPCHWFEVFSENEEKWKDARMPSRSLRHDKFAKFLRRFAKQRTA